MVVLVLSENYLQAPVQPVNFIMFSFYCKQFPLQGSQPNQVASLVFMLLDRPVCLHTVLIQFIT